MNKKLVLMMVAGIVTGTCFSAVKDVDEKTEKQWLNCTLPLPHEISIKNENIVNPKDIGIKLPEKAGDIEKNAVAQLKQFFKGKSGIEPAGSKFEIIIGVLDQDGKVCGTKVENAERLKTLPNNDQAYLIRPVGEDKLVLAALNPKGVFYAVQTLKQLLSKQINKDSVSIPLANIADWPDMDQRGFWNIGYATPGLIPWLASLKLNFTSWGTGIILKKDAKAECPKLPVDLIKQARNCAFLAMPHSAHFDYWWRYGRDTLYPELVGKGDGSRNPCYKWGPSFAKCHNPCMATPLLKRLITEWIESAAAQGVREFSLWLSEHTAQCECKECLKDGRKQMQKETRACVDAIMAARKKYPDLQGRIFFTMSKHYGNTIEDMNECLAMVPPEIKAERVYSANEAFNKYAADGHWLVSYSGPTIGPGFFTVRYMADEMKKCVKEYYDKKYSGIYPRGRSIVVSPKLIGHWEKVICNYQFSAYAEWSWNINGRNVRQFAEAWATVNHIDHPELFADWIELARPIESFVRYWEGTQTGNWLKAADGLKNTRTVPAWIKKLPKPEEMQKLLSKCEQALPIAEKINDKSVLLESRYLLTYLLAMIQFRDLYNQCPAEKAGLPENIKNIQESAKKFDALIAELDQLCNALMSTPEVDPRYGPEKAKEIHGKWKKALREKVDASVKEVIK